VTQKPVQELGERRAGDGVRRPVSTATNAGCLGSIVGDFLKRYPEVRLDERTAPARHGA
jgi:hypothetical protein